VPEISQQSLAREPLGDSHAPGLVRVSWLMEYTIVFDLLKTGEERSRMTDTDPGMARAPAD
jgi:hypothetical protein